MQAPLHKTFGKRIDTHDHFRGGKEENYKATVEYSYSLLEPNGIVAAVDMPNLKPNVTTEELLEDRLEYVRSRGCLNGYYINMGVTNRPEQIRKAAEIGYRHPRVPALKCFLTKGLDISLPEQNDRFVLFETLAKTGLPAIVIPHCEEESEFNEGAFNPKEPWTWGDQRPPKSEEKAVESMLGCASDTGYKGHIHFPHISSPRSFSIIKGYLNKGVDFTTSIELTPHHLLHCKEELRGDYGLDLKCNPPIVGIELVNLLWDIMKNPYPRIPIMTGSDNAPHSIKEKRGYPYASGYQSLRIPTSGMSDYQKLIWELQRRGFSEDEIHSLTYGNAKRIFTKIME